MVSVREPTALIIGTTPSAASFLRRLLTQRDDVHVPEGPSSVDDLLAGRVGRYLARFDDWKGETTTVDEVDLLRHRARPAEAAGVVAATLPRTKLVVVLRAPWVRAGQAFEAHREAGRIDPDVTFWSYLNTIDHELDPLEVIAGGWYGALLAPYLRADLPVHVIIEEEFGQDPARVWFELLDYLGVGWGAHDAPPVLLRDAFSSARPWDREGGALSDDEEWHCRLLYQDQLGEIDDLLGRPVSSLW